MITYFKWPKCKQKYPRKEWDVQQNKQATDKEQQNGESPMQLKKAFNTEAFCQAVHFQTGMCLFARLQVEATWQTPGSRVSRINYQLIIESVMIDRKSEGKQI